MERLYLDTSVFGGYYDLEFEFWTKILFDGIKKGDYKILYSRLTDIELSTAPQAVKELALDIPANQLELIDFTEEAEKLADMYLLEKVVGSTSRPDCLHIAMATINNADILISWNFKHIVNVKRIRGYNSINYRQGYKILEIRTPREILEQ